MQDLGKTYGYTSNRIAEAQVEAALTAAKSILDSAVFVSGEPGATFEARVSSQTTPGDW